jgi:hemerythrin-like domain-containing protein
VTETDSTAAYGAHRHTDPVQSTGSYAGEAQDEPAGRHTKLVDIRDMLVVHAALMREFRLAPAAVTRVKPGDRKHAQYVDEHLALICNMLHEHHVGEDNILWPPLRARLSAAECRLLDKTEAQHVGINNSLERVEDARRGWLDQPDQDHRGALATELQALYGLVSEHLADEEHDVIPLAATYLTEPQWRAISKSVTVLSPKAMLIGFGMCCYGADPEVTGIMLVALPAPVRLVVPAIARRMYARHSARIHGTRRP